MGGRERGGAGRVDGDRRSAQVQGVRDAPGQHAARGAAGQVEVLEVRVGDVQVLEVVPVHPGEDAGAAGPQLLQRQAGVLDRLPGGLQQDPLLRVDLDGFARRDLEERGVEVVDVAEVAAVTLVRPPGRGAGVVEHVDIPPVRRNRPDRVPPFEQGLPERRRTVAARKAAAHPDHGDGFMGARDIHRGPPELHRFARTISSVGL